MRLTPTRSACWRAAPRSSMVGRPLASRVTSISTRRTPGAPAGAESLHGRFFGGEPGGVPFAAVAMAFAIGDFLRREDALNESAAVPRDGSLDAVDLGNVRAQSDDHITPSRSRTAHVAKFGRAAVTMLVIPGVAIWGWLFWGLSRKDASWRLPGWRKWSPPGEGRARLLRRDLLQPTVLFLQLTRPSGLAHFQAPVLRFPVVERSFTDADSPAEVLHGTPASAPFSTPPICASLKTASFRGGSPLAV
jgi:hypothetical protein